jgi:hypothetical protein
LRARPVAKSVARLVERQTNCIHKTAAVRRTANAELQAASCLWREVFAQPYSFRQLTDGTGAVMLARYGEALTLHHTTPRRPP